MDKITLNGVDYVPAIDANPTPTALQIVVLQRGWVVVGYTHTDDTGELTITNANTIRRWGTTKGLGQLALEGPKPETKLDKAGTCRAHPGAVVLVIDCDESKWSL